MAEMNGSQILARTLELAGVQDIFYLMGGPMIAAENACAAAGIRMIDVRHEQAAAMMANAYARLRNVPGVCMACSGPGTINLTTGMANALIDGAPVVALGGSSPVNIRGRQAFQEIDQMAIMAPCAKHALRVHHPERIPEHLNEALQTAVSGKPGPVYIDLPGDVLYRTVDEAKIDWRYAERPLERRRPAAGPADIELLAKALLGAERPVVVSGSGVLWSEAWLELGQLVDSLGMPFYTTPQGRGVIAEDHECCFPSARSLAFAEADLILVVGTRLNYIFNHLAPPRFNAEATVARIDIDAGEIATSLRKLDIGIVGDAKAVLAQLNQVLAGHADPARRRSWRNKLAAREEEKRARPGDNSRLDEEPIHPLRLCEEVKNFMDRDAVLVVDGHEILNFGRQSMPTHTPGHRLNSGPFGTMGVGLPLGLGAKVAKPDKQVIVVQGDGSFGLNAMELDTAVRHNIPVLVVISLNGGWSAADPPDKPGRDLGFTRYDRMAEALGCYGDYVEKPADLGPALRRARAEVDQGRVAVVNVKTDEMARATTLKFAQYAT
jgi:thiamine pyrophosphate-dependent acetolactate synthase large subunit-like protein